MRSLHPAALLALLLSSAHCGGQVSSGDFSTTETGPSTVDDSAITDGSSDETIVEDGSILPGDSSPVEDSAPTPPATKCADDGACGAATPRCDVMTGTCAGCTDVYCSGLGMVCDAATKVCIECAKSSDCPMGRTCDPLSHSCARSCKTSADCHGGRVCDTSTGTCVDCLDDGPCMGGRCDKSTRTCVECLVSSDCSPGAPICDATHTCTANCTTESDCAKFGGAHCDPASGHCYECVRNDQCGMDGFCQLDHTCGGG